MKINLLLTLIWIVTIPAGSYAQSIPTGQNIVDSQGLKSGKWVQYFDISGKRLDKADNAVFYRLITYKNGKPEGKVRDYLKNGTIQFEGLLLKDDPDQYDGEITRYSDEGYIVNIEFYQAGVLDAEKSIPLLEKVVSEHQKNIPDHLSYATSIANLAVLYNTARKNTEAEQLFNQAIAIYKDQHGETTLDYANCLNGLGSLYYGKGLYAQAEPFLLQTLKIRKERLGEDNATYSISLNNLASLFKNTGRYAEAEPLYKKSLEIKKATVGESSLSYAVNLNNLAQLYEFMGRFSEAEPLYLQSCKIRKEVVGETHPSYGLSVNNLAQLYSSMGRYSEAEPLQKLALKIDKDRLGESHPSYATGLNNLGKIYLNMGRYPEAEPLLQQAAKIYKDKLGETHPNYAAALFGLARVYQAMDTLPELTLSYYEKSIAINAKSYGVAHPKTSTMKISQSSFHYQHGELQPAFALFSEHLVFLEQYLQKYFNYLGESEREAFYKNVKNDFEIFAALAFREYKQHPELLATAFNLQLRYKALLLSTNNLIRKRIMSSGDRQLISLYDEVQAIKQLLGKTVSLSDKDFQTQRGMSRDSLQKVLATKDQQLTQLSSLYASESKLPTLEDVRAKLGKKEAVVEIVRYRGYDFTKQVFTDKVHYAALIITAKTVGHPEVVFFGDGNYLEGKGISFYRNSIMGQAPDSESYKSFWMPLKAKLKNIDKIYLCPDGVFHSININTLLNPNTEHFLSDEIKIDLISGSKDLLLAKDAPLPQKIGFLIGNPDFGGKADLDGVAKNSNFSVLLASVERGGSISDLPGTEVEVQQIQSLLKANKWRETKLLNEEAKEERLKTMLKPNILHIASHGFFQSDVDGNITYASNPLYRSGILLSGAAETLDAQADLRGNANIGKEDGILTAFEALNLNIDNTDLVVLSACETGLGEVRNGEGVFGLQRAFKLAGARTVLMSLWKVNDQTTQELMVSFYENWLAGLPKKEAFNKAQAQLRAKYPHPYHWGAFVMIGE